MNFKTEKKPCITPSPDAMDGSEMTLEGLDLLARSVRAFVHFEIFAAANVKILQQRVVGRGREGEEHEENFRWVRGRAERNEYSMKITMTSIEAIFDEKTIVDNEAFDTNE